MVSILDVCHGHRSVAHSIVDDRVHRNRHAVFCQDLFKKKCLVFLVLFFSVLLNSVKPGRTQGFEEF